MDNLASLIYRSGTPRNIIVHMCCVLIHVWLFVTPWSPPGSSARGTFQASILEWVRFPTPGDLPNAEIEPASGVSCIGHRLFTTALCGKLRNCVSVCVCLCVCLCAQSCSTLCNPLDCNTPDSCVHGIFQARMLKWVAISSSRGFSWPRDQIHVSCISCIAGRFFTWWGIGEA